MAFQIENWDYSDSPEKMSELIKRLLMSKSVTALYDADRDEAIFLIGDGSNPDIDRRQAELACVALNTLERE